MSKSSKTWIYIVVNILCAALFFIGCCNSVLRSCALLIWAFSFVFLPYLAIINGISIYTVKKDKMKISAVLSLLGGSLGGFITARVLRKKSLAINIIFNISVWFVVWCIAEGYLFVFVDFMLNGAK
ncbi:MAG: hypothetical protein K2J11_07125 [Oscillospiraceae bacterium]|nr:hypothetical protein [Oscillospiraceae bacterium]